MNPPGRLLTQGNMEPTASDPTHGNVTRARKLGLTPSPAFLFYEFDFAGPPRLVKPRLGWAVEA